jgi:hypothetical protein
MKAFPKRVLLAATSALAVSLAVAGGQLADGGMHAADAARKHLAGVKYEDIPSTKKNEGHNRRCSSNIDRDQEALATFSNGAELC